MNSTHFITYNFLLQSDVAETLYQKYAKELPIIDYHNHLSAKQIAEDKPIKNITEMAITINGEPCVPMVLRKPT